MAAEVKAVAVLAHNAVFGATERFAIPSGVKSGAPSTELAVLEVDIRLAPAEKVRFYFRNKGPYNFVVLTDQRFVKIEDQKIVSTVDLGDVKGADHQKNGLFHWDKVAVTKHSGGQETFGIYQKDVTAFFTMILGKCATATPAAKSAA